MSSTGGGYLQAKQEGDSNNRTRKLHRTPSSGQRQLTGFKNPRIVRVSRSFGGKDRHSKVYTIRGLRDRRIRLSVQTAIQLYDLQDRLGLGQPSKVVDWLLDATKHEIDKLPPLTMQPEYLSQHPSSLLLNSQLELNACSSTQPSISPFFISAANLPNMKYRGTYPFLSNREGIKFHDHVDQGDDQTIMERTNNWVHQDPALNEKCKELPDDDQTDTNYSVLKTSKWMTRNDQENPGGIGNYIAQVSAQNIFPALADQSSSSSTSSYPGLLNNCLPYNPFYHWDIPNLSLSQYGSLSHGLSSQREYSSSSHSVLCGSSLALPSTSQFNYYFPFVTTPSIIPPFPPCPMPMENDPKQLHYLQLLSPSSQRMSPNSIFMPSLNLLRSPVKSSTVNSKSQNSSFTQQ